MNVGLKAYLNNMSEHERYSYIKHMISFPSWRLAEIKNLDLGLWRVAQKIANKSPRGEMPYVAELDHRRH